MIYYKNKKQIKFNYIIRGVLPLGIGLIMRVMLGPQLFFFGFEEPAHKVFDYEILAKSAWNTEAGRGTDSIHAT